MELDLISTDEAAKELKIKKETLAVWRCKTPGRLAHYKIGRTIWYSRHDISAFKKSCRVGGSDEC